MPDDRFEARLRALAQQLSRSISEVDLDEVADRLGVDPDRVRGAAGAVEDWLNERANPAEPLFSTGPGEPSEYRHEEPAAHHEIPASPARAHGPHPLDLPTDDQGRALSALSSGRWTVRPGSGRLSNAEPLVGPPAPDAADLAGELRARDWITADGTVTVVGREALVRWCRTAHVGADRPAADVPDPSSTADRRGADGSSAAADGPAVPDQPAAAAPPEPPAPERPSDQPGPDHPD
ncbi:MAG TPA: hypothetical protein VKV21_13150 [Solirubrobacteraceae bacterium]|nr:hypothetical protein [Solirubrobacteraceae bacterium]